MLTDTGRADCAAGTRWGDQLCLALTLGSGLALGPGVGVASGSAGAAFGATGAPFWSTATASTAAPPSTCSLIGLRRCSRSLQPSRSYEDFSRWARKPKRFFAAAGSGDGACWKNRRSRMSRAGAMFTMRRQYCRPVSSPGLSAGWLTPARYRLVLAMLTLSLTSVIG